MCMLSQGILTSRTAAGIDKSSSTSRVEVQWRDRLQGIRRYWYVCTFSQSRSTTSTPLEPSGAFFRELATTLTAASFHSWRRRARLKCCAAVEIAGGDCLKYCAYLSRLAQWGSSALSHQQEMRLQRIAMRSGGCLTRPVLMGTRGAMYCHDAFARKFSCFSRDSGPTSVRKAKSPMRAPTVILVSSKRISTFRTSTAKLDMSTVSRSWPLRRALILSKGLFAVFRFLLWSFATLPSMRFATNSMSLSLLRMEGSRSAGFGSLPRLTITRTLLRSMRPWAPAPSASAVLAFRKLFWASRSARSTGRAEIFRCTPSTVEERASPSSLRCWPMSS
mmetsp:Transcript_41572/g.109740  ORF Transcript_41572/g.109740 Transcript_41572/m.109740 type:complete len:333 (-) Transcript_41572:938-1936(-)